MIAIVWNPIGYELIRKYGYEEYMFKEAGLIMLLEVSTSIVRGIADGAELTPLLSDGFINGLGIVLASIGCYTPIMDLLGGEDDLSDIHENPSPMEDVCQNNCTLISQFENVNKMEL